MIPSSHRSALRRSIFASLPHCWTRYRCCRRGCSPRLCRTFSAKRRTACRCRTRRCSRARRPYKPTPTCTHSIVWPAPTTSERPEGRTRPLMHGAARAMHCCRGEVHGMQRQHVKTSCCNRARCVALAALQASCNILQCCAAGCGDGWRVLRRDAAGMSRASGFPDRLRAISVLASARARAHACLVSLP